MQGGGDYDPMGVAVLTDVSIILAEHGQINKEIFHHHGLGGVKVNLTGLMLGAAAVDNG